MNVVTFNDKIREMMRKQPPAVTNLLKIFPGWETAPLFMYDEPSNEAETTAIISGFERTNGEIFEHTPFPVWRLDINVGETDKPEYGRYRAKALCANYPDGLAVLGRADSLLHTKLTYPFRGLSTQKMEDRYLPIYMFMHQIRLADHPRPDKADFTCSSDACFGIGGCWNIRSDNEPMWQKMATNYFNGLLKSIAAFNISANSPSNHVAEVMPDQPGRSVEWKKARTHYTLITHGHPANNTSVSHGSKVAADPTEELTRLAHNRRAHQRTLRAARFRYARGKTIWVKAAWIGPKEWRDEGGKQIYRILEPVAEAKVA